MLKSELYELITTTNNFRFVTVSPPDCGDYQITYDEFLRIMIKYRKNMSNLLLVCEMSDNERLHFHFIYNFIDHKKHNFLINKEFRGNKWNTLNTQFPPKGGYEYLMKDHNISHYVDQSIFTITDINNLFSVKLAARKVAFKLAKMKREGSMDLPITPRCFRESDSTSSDLAR